MVAVGGFVGYLAYTVNDNVTQAQLLPENRPPVTAPDGIGRSPRRVPATNFLVVGADTRPGDVGRSDVIVLVHVPEDDQSIQMIHFPRDLYVDIPGHGKDKINAAYAYGGEPLLVADDGEPAQDPHPPRGEDQLRRLQEDDGCRGRRARVRGGVEQGRATVASSSRRAGTTSTATQALAYVRERYSLSEGDISRGRRQLSFIKALMLKATTRRRSPTRSRSRSSPTPPPRT